LILAYLDLLQVSLWLFLVFFGSVVGALLVGITFHEFCHCLAAFSLGDPTARNMGRMSLNPKVHLDPVGTLLLFVAGFGWGKPAPVNPYRLRTGPKSGMALVAAAGPLSNLVIAAAAGLPIHAGIVPWRTPFVVPHSVAAWDGADYLGLFLSSVVIFNCVLAVFNLIPVAPLDGFRVAVGILPRDLSEAVAGLEQYGIAILMLLLVLPMLTNGAVGIFPVISPAIDRLAGVFTGVNGNVFG
jgi:Zn-dependent protease